MKIALEKPVQHRDETIQVVTLRPVSLTDVERIREHTPALASFAATARETGCVDRFTETELTAASEIIATVSDMPADAVRRFDQSDIRILMGGVRTLLSNAADAVSIAIAAEAS